MGKAEDLPTGKELAICKAFRRIGETLRKIDSELEIADMDSCNFQINVGHSIEGVRTNGWQRLTTIIDAMKDLRQYEANQRRSVMIHVKAAKKVEDLLIRAEKLMSEYEECNACKGKKGVYDRSVRDYDLSIGQWQDCDNCAGRGMVEKLASKRKRIRK